GVSQSALDTLAQALAEIGEQALVPNEPQVRGERVADVRGVSTKRALTEDVRGSRYTGVAFHRHHLIPSAVVDEADVEAEVGRKLPAVSDRGIEVVGRRQIRIDRLHRGGRDAQKPGT